MYLASYLHIISLSDNYHSDLFDYLVLPEPEVIEDVSPPSTPPPEIRQHSFDLDCSYQDEFFTGN